MYISLKTLPSYHYEKISLMKSNLQKGMENCPIIVSRNGVVLDGNHRVIAAREAGIKTIKGVIINAEIVEINVNDLRLGWQPYASSDEQTTDTENCAKGDRMAGKNKYMILVYYAHEGWCIVESTDEKDEIQTMYEQRRGQGDDIMVVKLIPVKVLVEMEDENE